MGRNYVWQKQQLSPDLEVVNCPVYDDIKDFSMEPSGCYVLIRIEPDAQMIEVAICDKKHVIIKAYRGKKSQDIYHRIFADEKKYEVEWFKSKDHMAYLGKELKKAEVALASKTEYYQE